MGDILASGAGVFRAGQIGMRLITRDDTPAYIYGLEVVRFRVAKEMRPAWVIELDGDMCGGDVLGRLFASDVTKGGDVVDLGTAGTGGDVMPAVPTAPLGTGFTVAAGDPALLLLDVYACTGYFEFGLVIHYVFRGDQYTYEVGSREEPLRIMGTDAPVPHYVFSEESEKPGPHRKGLVDGGRWDCEVPSAEPAGD
jgi:hypothetical protein